MINQQYLQFVQGQLAQFATQDNFESTIFTAFGDRVDLLLLQDLRQQWLTGDFSVIPETQVVENGELGGAKGAYAAELDRIFVAADFLATAGERSIRTVLLEEVGHRIDRLLNGGLDSAGDEGEIFSRLLQGEIFSKKHIEYLKSEDDSATVIVNNQLLRIERSQAPTGTAESLQYKDYLVAGDPARWPTDFTSNKTTISYSFLEAFPLNYSLAIGATAANVPLVGTALAPILAAGVASRFTAFNEAQQLAAKNALDTWAEFIDVDFVAKNITNVELSDIFDFGFLNTILNGLTFDDWSEFTDWVNEHIGTLIGFPITDDADIRFGLIDNPIGNGSGFAIPPLVSPLIELGQFKAEIFDFVDEFFNKYEVLKYIVPGASLLSLPNIKLGVQGDVWLNTNPATNIDLNKLSSSSSAFQLILHETGHALGLKHPGDDDASGFIPTPEPYLPSETDNQRYSIMSYNPVYDYYWRQNKQINQLEYVNPSTPMLYDIFAIQDSYKANKDTRSDNTTYSWNNNAPVVLTIWDGGGIDTVDVSNQSTNSIINLNEGEFSSVGALFYLEESASEKIGTEHAEDNRSAKNIGIAYGTVIENAASGGGNDLLIGNGGTNILMSGSGNDLLIGEGGADQIDGGDGFDITSYRTSKSGVVVNLVTGVNGGDAEGDTFRSIEQITGSAYADSITGDTANNIIEGGTAGHDTINGGDGDDILLPNWGDDVVDGGNGTDTLVIDYSTLPTQAVAWLGNHQYDQGRNYVYVRNAYGIGDAIRTELDTQGGSFSLSGDGTTIAISGKVKDQNGIWVKNFIDDTNTTKIDDLRGDSVSLSKDGSKITWTRIDNRQIDFRTASEIFVASTDGSQVKRLTNDNINDTLATISDDGSTVAWARAITPDLHADGSKFGTYKTEIFVSNFDGSNVRRITNNKWNDPQRSLSLSANGSKITWQVDGIFGPTGGERDTLANGYWIANTDGTELRQLYQTGISNQNVSISNDGSKVAWGGIFSGEASQSYVNIIDADNPNAEIVPNTIGAWAFSEQSFSGDGQRVVFSRNDTSSPNYGQPTGLYVASVDGTEPLTLIDNSPGWTYGGNSATGAAISDYVDKGVIYNSFDSVTGSGEIYTWGPSRVRYSNIERFDIIGTRYGDELRGGNLDDRLVGGGGADILKGFLGNDTYGFNIANSAGSQIEDTGGNDVLELKNTITDSSGIQKDESVEISLSSPNNGIIGIERDGSNLIIDINQDGIATAKTDLSIINFFNATGTDVGNGFIETIQNLAGNDILTKFKAIDVTSPPSQLVISNNQIAENTLVNTIVGNLSATSSNGDILTYSLITGTGDTDNNLFEIVDNTVRVKISPDFEIKNNYTVRIKATNQKELSTEKPFSINIINTNEAPSQITIDNLQISENSPINTVVGNLSSIDPDNGDTITYSILPINDYQSFSIVGNQLQLATIPDFETKSTYQLQLQATDQAGLKIDKSFTIGVNDLPETSTPPVTPTPPETPTLPVTPTPPETPTPPVTPTPPETPTPPVTPTPPETPTLPVTPTPPETPTPPVTSIPPETPIPPVTSIPPETLTPPVTPTPLETPRLTINSNQTLQINGTPGINHLSFQLNNQNQQSFSETVLFKVDDNLGSINGKKLGEAGYIQAALDRFQVISSSLATNSLPQGFDGNTNRSIDLNYGDIVRLAAINNGSIDQLRQSQIPLSQIIFSDPTTTNFTETKPGEITLNWQGAINLSLTAKLNSEVTLGTNTQHDPQGEMLDFRQSTTDISATFTIYREAAYNNSVYIYAIQDETGTILDATTNTTFKPTDAGYLQAALRNAVTDVNLNTANQSVTTSSTKLSKGSLFAPIIVINGNKNALLDNNLNNDPAAYTPFVLGNADKVDHIRLLGDNIFGFEDLPAGGDMDYNDIIVKMDFRAV